MGLEPKHFPQGLWRIADEVGFQIEIEIVAASLLEGITSKNYQQFESIRTIRTMHQHLYESGPAHDSRSFKTTGEQHGKTVIVKISHCPTDLLFFTRFMHGCLSRIGKEVKSDMALGPDILHLVLGNLKNEWYNNCTSVDRKRLIGLVGYYLVVSFACSLRDNEGLMMDLHRLISHITDGRHDLTTPYVVIPLLGRFKNETGECLHLILSVNVTNSGFQVRTWIERLVRRLVGEGKRDDPAMCDPDGYLIESGLINKEFREQMAIIQTNRPDLIKATLDVFEI